ncbi:hypothetical protein GCM10010493_18670 [Streptomyces lavendulae subsp. grasserius]
MSATGRERSGAGQGRLPQAETIGAVARSRRPVATFARCRSISASVASHPSRGPDAFGQPEGYGGPACADLPAPHAGGEPECVDVPERHRVEELADRLEPGPGLGLPVVQQVAVVRVPLAHGAILAERGHGAPGRVAGGRGAGV